jgi:hypothetical protein
MGLDIRKPIGVLFVVLGLQLAVWGLVRGGGRAERSFGVNVNLGWGVMLAAAGGLSLLLSAPTRR